LGESAATPRRISGSRIHALADRVREKTIPVSWRFADD
jgi:hypothetical protein